MKQQNQFSADIYLHENDSVGQQPRKFNIKKMKKSHGFDRFEQELDALHKHRHSYNRAADKTVTRTQVRYDEF